MLAISNLLWFKSSTECIFAVWGLHSFYRLILSLHSISTLVLPHPRTLTSHVRDNLWILWGACCSPPYHWESKETHFLRGGGIGRNSPFFFFLSLLSASPLSSPSISISFGQGRSSPPAVSLSIFTVHFTLAQRRSAAAIRESGGALAKCSCPLTTWMFSRTTNTRFLHKLMHAHRGVPAFR